MKKNCKIAKIQKYMNPENDDFFLGILKSIN